MSTLIHPLDVSLSKRKSMLTLFLLCSWLGIHRPLCLYFILCQWCIHLKPIDQCTIVICCGGDVPGTPPTVIHDELQAVLPRWEAQDGVEVVCTVISSAKPVTTHLLLSGMRFFQLSAKFPVTNTCLPPPFHWMVTSTNPSFSSAGGGGVGAEVGGGGVAPLVCSTDTRGTGTSLPGIGMGTDLRGESVGGKYEVVLWGVGVAAEADLGAVSSFDIAPSEFGPARGDFAPSTCCHLRVGEDTASVRLMCPAAGVDGARW